MLKFKKIITSLVTGGAGFIGSHIVDKLIELGHKVIVLDNLSTGNLENVNSKADFRRCNIINQPQLFELIGYQEINGFIFHCAAKARIQPSFKNPDLYYQTNIIGLENILELAHINPIKKFIFTSSSSVYGQTKLKLNTPLNEKYNTNPGSPYSKQKLLGENIIKTDFNLFQIPAITCRLFNVYGPRQLTTGAYATVIGIFLKQFKENKKLTVVKPGTQRRDFTYISDIVDGLIKAAKSKIKSGQVFNLGSGVNYSVQEIADIISPKQKYLPKRKGEYPYTLANINKAIKTLNYRPKILNINHGIQLCKQKQKRLPL